MAGEKVYSIITGRLVRGDLFTGSDKNYEGQPRVNKQGQPVTAYYIALAVRKDDVTAHEFWALHTAIGERDFPSGQSKQPGFKGKIQDGDQPHMDTAGKLVAWPEWARGCFIVALNQVNQPIQVVDQNNAQIIDRNLIKIGDYVMVSVGGKSVV